MLSRACYVSQMSQIVTCGAICLLMLSASPSGSICLHNIVKLPSWDWVGVWTESFVSLRPQNTFRTNIAPRCHHKGALAECSERERAWHSKVHFYQHIEHNNCSSPYTYLCGVGRCFARQVRGLFPSPFFLPSLLIHPGVYCYWCLSSLAVI